MLDYHVMGDGLAVPTVVSLEEYLLRRLTLQIREQSAKVD